MRSILIVDDDPASLTLVEGVLDAEGYETRKAEEPVEALEITADRVGAGVSPWRRTGARYAATRAC